MQILVDHLTRMATGYFCVAGLDPRGRHVRPVLRRGRLPVGLLSTQGGPFALESVVDLGETEAVGTAPEVEDHAFDPHRSSAVRQIDSDEFWTQLERDSELALVDIFGHDLRTEHRGAVVPIGAGRASLGTLDPGYRPRVMIKEGRIRCLASDPDFGELDLAVTDVRLYRLLDTGWEPNETAVRALQREMESTKRVMLSVGLTRPWPETTHAIGCRSTTFTWLLGRVPSAGPTRVADSSQFACFGGWCQGCRH